MGDEGDLLAELGVLLEEDVEGGEPAQHVLREVGAVDAEDQVVAAALQQLLLVADDLLGLGGAVEPRRCRSRAGRRAPRSRGRRARRRRARSRPRAPSARGSSAGSCGSRRWCGSR